MKNATAVMYTAAAAAGGDGATTTTDDDNDDDALSAVSQRASARVGDDNDYCRR